MNASRERNSLEDLIGAVQAHVPPEAMADFEERVVESRLALDRIAGHLATLASDAHILEIGAGTFLLAGALAGAGWRVTALEPVSGGFDYFRRIQVAVEKEIRVRGWAIDFLRVGVEDLTGDQQFDFIFSYHVFEHVPDLRIALERTLGALRPSGTMFIACPNFAFPYEGHFSVPIIGNKAITHRLFRRRIESHKRFADPAGVWQSLNWITAASLAVEVGRLGSATIRFRSGTIFQAFERAVRDPIFRNRHPAAVIALCRLVVFLRLHHLDRLIGHRFAPLIEADIVKAIEPR